LSPKNQALIIIAIPEFSGNAQDFSQAFAVTNYANKHDQCQNDSVVDQGGRKRGRRTAIWLEPVRLLADERRRQRLSRIALARESEVTVV
jgi:hypothetical protein